MARYGYLFSVVGVIIPLLIGCMLDLYVFIPIKLSGIQVDAIDLYIFQVERKRRHFLWTILSKGY